MNHITPGLWADEKPEVEEIELKQEYWPDTEAPFQILSASEKLSYATSAFGRVIEASTSAGRSVFFMDSMSYMIHDELVYPSNHKNDKHRTRPKSYSGRPSKW